MKLLKDLSLGAKFSLVTALSLSVVFAVLITMIYYNRKEKRIAENDVRFFSQLTDLVSILDEQRKAQEAKAKQTLVLAETVIRQKGEIIESDSLINFMVNNSFANTQENLKINALYLGGNLLQGDTVMVDEFAKQTGSGMAILQQTSLGFLNVSTSEINKARFVGAFSTQKSVLEAINASMPYIGNVLGEIVGKTYTIATKVLYTTKKTKIVLIVYVFWEEKGAIQKSISSKKYLENGFPYLMSKTGKILFHPSPKAVGVNIAKSAVYAAMSSNIEGQHKYFYIDQAGVSKYQYYTYYQPLDMFVNIVIPQDDLLDKPLASLRNFLVAGGIIGILFFNIVLIFFGMMFSVRPIKKIASNLSKLAKGKSLEVEEVKQQDEYGQIFAAINQLIQRFNNASRFAKEIGKGNFQNTYLALGEQDELGNALIEMRDDLQKGSEKEIQRQWFSKGIAKFNELIRMNNNQIQELTSQVLAYLIKYVNANQGAIFLITDGERKEPCLELSASYAYKRRKYAQKRIYLGEGLIGQTWQEGEPVYLKNVPAQYAQIGSGLGDATPACLFVVPLQFNNSTQGVLEISSFRVFTPNEKTFIIQIMASLAAAVSVTKFNENTQKLLHEAQYMMENLRSQEEEMRQNYEELQATQEEMFRREQESKLEKEELMVRIKELEMK
jgi:putative methionine-R-sulfoxide reductase with GAF domain